MQHPCRCLEATDLFCAHLLLSQVFVKNDGPAVLARLRSMLPYGQRCGFTFPLWAQGSSGLIEALMLQGRSHIGSWA